MEEFITSLDANYLIWLFMLMAADGVGVPLPSEVPLLYAGYLISQDKLELIPSVLAGTAGLMVGSIVLYELSRRIGRAAVLRWGKRLNITEPQLDRAEAWFDHRGQGSVLVCRLVPLARTLISIPAGIASMDRTKFTIYTLLGSLPWAFALIYVGKILGDSWRDVLGTMSIVGLVAAAIIGVGLVWWIVKRRQEARRIEQAEQTPHS